jgi:hypothetical protein
MFKVIIAGGREYNDYETLKKVCDHMLQNKTDIQIVSGGATGADHLGERYAKEMGYDLKIFMADWKSFGTSAGPKRNKQMAEYGDALIAFWNGKSKGTQNMIDQAHKLNLKIKIYRY